MANENPKSFDLKNSRPRMSRDKSRSRSPLYRSRSKSPREWKRPERRGSDRDRSFDGLVRLYVSNLPYDMRWQELKDLFKEKVGSDVSFTQLYDGQDGRPSGSGVVEVKSRDAATKSIDILDRYEIKGRKIIVREEREKDRQRHGASEFRDSHMGGKSDLGRMGGGGGGMMGGSGSMMGGGGGVVSLMNSSGLTSQSGGRGFTVEVMSQLGIEISNITNQVFVANLDYKTTKGKLEEVFRIAGNVIDAEIKSDKEGKSRGMGIVRFEHPIEAVQAISLFNGQYLYDRQMGVRMDRWVEPIMQDIAPRLPAGLKGIGIGMGAGGQPLLNLGEIANTLTLSMLTGQLGASPMGMMGNTMAAGMGASMGLNMAAMGSNMIGLAGSNMGLGNVASSMMGGMAGNMGSLSSGNMGGMSGNMGGMVGSMGGMSSGMGSTGMNTSMNNYSSGLVSMGSNGTNAMLGSMGLGGGMSGMGMTSGMGTDSSYLSSGISNSMMGAMGGTMGTGMAGLSDNRMGGGDQYGSGLGGRDGGNYDRGGSYDRGNSSFDRGSDRNESRPSENSTIFVKNLPYNFTTQNMYDKFRDCGDVKFAEIKMESSSGRSRGCGIVQFYNSDSARRAISLMNGARIDGRVIEVRLDRML